jgi:GNAT superfamily N-acetyltransferase
MDAAIQKTIPGDMDFVYQLFDQAAAYQISRNFPAWLHYDNRVLESDMKAGRQFKITTGHEISAVFSVLYSDEILWREREKNDALYLHRIVSNPAFRGQKQFGRILSWTMELAKEKNRHFIRMDTWAENPNLLAYYAGYGFQWVENFMTPNSPDLPRHNRNILLALLELGV